MTQLATDAHKLPMAPIMSVLINNRSRQLTPRVAVKCFFHAIINRGKSSAY